MWRLFYTFSGWLCLFKPILRGVLATSAYAEVGLLSATLNYWQGILTFASTMLLAMAAAYGSWAGCGAYGRCLWARSSGRFGDVEDSSATDEWVGEAPNPNAAVTIQL